MFDRSPKMAKVQIVRYLPKYPNTNHILGGYERRGSNFGIGFGVLMLLLSPNLYWMGLKQASQQLNQSGN